MAERPLDASHACGRCEPASNKSTRAGVPVFHLYFGPVARDFADFLRGPFGTLNPLEADSHYLRAR